MFKHILLGLTSLLLLSQTPASSLDIKIIESQSNGHTMDQNWLGVVNSMGHTGSIHPQTLLNNNSFFASTDVLIVSSGVIALTAPRIAIIQQFLQTGKPVYLQTEYDCNYTSNQAFAQIVVALGGTFNWGGTTAGTLAPMIVLGTFANTNVPVVPLSYYWYSCHGIPGCNVFPFLSYGNQFHGFFFCPPNQAFGRMITTTDQDWVQSNTSLPLMQNIITHLITPSLCSSNNTISLNLGNDTSLCTFPFVLNATTTNATYLWNNGTTQPTLSINGPGTYWVEVNVNGCTARDSITISSGTGNAVNLGNDTTICAGPLVLNATTPNASSYLWNNGTTQPTLTVNNAGTYWVEVNVNGCPSRDTIVINIGSPSLINLGNDTTLCPGATLGLTAGPPGLSYSWQDGSTNTTFTVTQPGLYWVTATFGNCVDSDSIQVNYQNVTPVDLGPDILACTGSAIQLNATTPGATGYLWQNGTTSPQLSVNANGTYWVEVSYGNCKDADTINVAFGQSIPGNFLQDVQACAGDIILLQAPAGQLGYQWSNGANTSSIQVQQSGTYTVIVDDGLCGIYDSATVTIIPLPTVELGEPRVLCEDSVLVLRPLVIDPTLSYTWNNDVTQNQITIDLPGLYVVTANNVCGSDTDSVVVRSERCVCFFYVPNTFTVNQDGKNEIFKPGFYCELKRYEMKIYNRWGELLFFSDNPYKGWDGNVGATAAPIGVYVYQLTYASDIFGAESEVVKRGQVNLLR